MENTLVWNVLFKGVEKNPSNRNWAKAFGSFKKAEEFMRNYAELNELFVHSTFGWMKGHDWDADEFTVGAINDWYMSDKEGNSYYFVIYVQEI